MKNSISKREYELGKCAAKGMADGISEQLYTLTKNYMNVEKKYIETKDRLDEVVDKYWELVTENAKLRKKCEELEDESDSMHAALNEAEERVLNLEDMHSDLNEGETK